MTEIRKAVIIAAGPGKRLRPLTSKTHKTLIPIAGKPLISHILLSLKEWGLRDVVMVIGYMGETVKFFVGDGRAYGLRVKYVHNLNYDRGNGLSVLAAKKRVGSDPFILLMSDHLFDGEILGRIVCEDDFSLCVDSELTYLPDPDEATKVLLDQDNYILDIGKEIPSWNCVDTGIFRCEPVIFDALKRLSRSRYRVTLTDAIRCLIRDYGYPIKGVDVSGRFWMDIDTPEDLNHAKLILGAPNA